MILILIICGVSSAQRRVPNSAILRLYPHPEELTTGAEKLTQQKRWGEVIGLYLNAMRDYPTHLIKLKGETYRGVQDFCLEKIGQLPEEGLKVYRERFDPAARSMMHDPRYASDPERLQEILVRYPFSSYTEEILRRLVELYIEAGDGKKGLKYLKMRRLKSPERSWFSLCEANCLWLLGNRQGLLKIFDTVNRELPSEKVMAGRSTILLRDYIARLIKDLKPKERKGNHEELAPKLSFTSKGFRYKLPSIRFTFVEDLGGWGWERRQTKPIKGYRPFFPQISNGVLYLHNEFAVYAFDLGSGKGEPMWRYKVKRPKGKLIFDDRNIHTITIHRGRVYANLVTDLGEPVCRNNWRIIESIPFPKRRLFALDAVTGKKLWQLGGKAQAKDFQDNLSFSTAPTAEGDRLYVGAIYQPNVTDPFKHYVLCLDPKTGEILWKTFIASGLTEMNLFNNATREAFCSPVTIYDDTLFYSTNIGAVAGLDKHTGRIKWVFRYRQTPAPATRDVQIERNKLEWINNPPIVWDNIVIFTPLDSKYLWALGRQDGLVKWKIKRRQGLRYIYGIHKEHLILGGDGIAIYDLKRKGKLIKFREGRSVGRGALCRQAIYFPASEGIISLTYRTLKKKGILRWSRTKAQKGGNILITNGTLVITTMNALIVHTDPQRYEQGFNKYLKENPQDGEILYRYAMRLKRRGQTTAAIEVLNKVIMLAKTGRSKGAQILEDTKRHLCELYMWEAQECWEKGKLREGQRFLEEAKRNAPTASARVEIWLKEAKMYASVQDYLSAIQIYQGLIKRNPQGYANMAKKEISKLLKQGGHSLGRDFEGLARKRLQMITGKPDLRAYAQIAMLYPYTTAAREALLKGFKLSLKSSRPELKFLQNLARDYPESEELSEGYLRLAELLDKKGRYASARGILGRVKGRHSKIARDYLARPQYKQKGPRRLKVPLKRVLVYQVKGRIRYAPMDGAEPYLLVLCNNFLKAIDVKGQPIWEKRLLGPPIYLAGLDESFVIVNETSITQFDARNQKLLWQIGYDRIVSATFREGFLYLLVIDQNNRYRLVVVDVVLRYINMEQRLAQIEGREPILWTHLDGQYLCLGTKDRLLMYRLRDGRFLWHFNLEWERDYKVAVQGDHLVVVLPGWKGQNVYVIKTGSGKLAGIKRGIEGDILSMDIDGERLYMVLEVRGAPKLVAMGLAGLEAKWDQTLRGSGVNRVIACDGYIAVGSAQKVMLFSTQGRKVQEIATKGAQEFYIRGGRLYVCYKGKIEIFSDR